MAGHDKGNEISKIHCPRLNFSDGSSVRVRNSLGTRCCLLLVTVDENSFAENSFSLGPVPLGQLTVVLIFIVATCCAIRAIN